jgi:DNA-directed RNA polymerase specialized sigma24 family protein
LQLARALPLLAVDQRIALELRYLHDPPASLADIAQRLERTEKAAAGLLCRGLARLRELMHQAE